MCEFYLSIKGYKGQLVQTFTINMTNLLNIEDYENIKKEKALQQVEKNNWKWYRKTGEKRPLKKLIARREARRAGISIH